MQQDTNIIEGNCEIKHFMELVCIKPAHVPIYNNKWYGRREKTYKRKFIHNQSK
jgi:hypothetical protein